MSLHHVINPNVIITAALIAKIHISAHVMTSINVNKNELKNNTIKKMFILIINLKKINAIKKIEEFN